MRTYETILTVIVFLTLLQAALLADRKPGVANFFLPIGTILVFALHAGLEKMRWQMAPVYGLAAFATVWALIPIAFPKPSNDVSKPGCLAEFTGDLITILGFLLLGIGALLSTAAPVFQIPAPGGPYPIGTQDIYLINPTRPEPFTANPNDVRELMVRVWYPAQPIDTAASPQPYWPGIERIGPLLLRQMGLPGMVP